MDSSVIFTICMLLLGFLACKKQVPVTESIAMADTARVKPVKNESWECYMAISGKDTILMRVKQDNNMAVGHLHYRFFEKDKSGGTIIGSMKGDTLIADYKFISEGMESEREVTFVRRGDEFVEGYGEITDRDGRQVFSNKKNLKYDGWPMKKVDCSMLAWYFKD